MRILPKLSLDYAEALRYLEISRNTIALSSHNYSQTVQQIQFLSPNYEEKIDFLAQFCEVNCPIFEQKIQGDLNYFKPGEKLIEQALSAIRGLLELEQTQRDRRFETQLQALAAGLGTAVIVAETSRYMVVPENSLMIPLINLPVYPFLTSVSLSILIGVLTFVEVGKYLRRLSKK